MELDSFIFFVSESASLDAISKLSRTYYYLWSVLCAKVRSHWRTWSIKKCIDELSGSAMSEFRPFFVCVWYLLHLYEMWMRNVRHADAMASSSLTAFTAILSERLFVSSLAHIHIPFVRFANFMLWYHRPSRFAFAERTWRWNRMPKW